MAAVPAAGATGGNHGGGVHARKLTQLRVLWFCVGWLTEVSRHDQSVHHQPTNKKRLDPQLR
jgi:hypothetical protein